MSSYRVKKSAKKTTVYKQTIPAPKKPQYVRSTRKPNRPNQTDIKLVKTNFKVKRKVKVKRDFKVKRKVTNWADIENAPVITTTCKAKLNGHNCAKGEYCISNIKNVKKIRCPQILYNYQGIPGLCGGIPINLINLEYLVEYILAHINCSCDDDVRHGFCIPGHKTYENGCSCIQRAGNIHHLRFCHQVQENSADYFLSVLFSLREVVDMLPSEYIEDAIHELFPQHMIWSVMTFLHQPSNVTLEEICKMILSRRVSNKTQNIIYWLRQQVDEYHMDSVTITNNIIMLNHTSEHPDVQRERHYQYQLKVQRKEHYRIMFTEE